MFYGLEFTQPEIAEDLRKLTESGQLPNAVLFDGSPYSSRMFAANCLSEFYNTDNSNTIIISNRPHRYSLNAAYNLLLKNRDDFSLSLLQNSVRIFIRQYHGALFDYAGTETKKQFAMASDINELLWQIRTDNPDLLTNNVSRLKEMTESLMKDGALGNTVLNVNHVRMIKNWSKETDNTDSDKTVIIEGIENATESANNALLKLIEEPPDFLHIILISQNRRSVLPTILSRVRTFHFPSWNTRTQETFFRRFSSGSGLSTDSFENMEEFFMEKAGCDLLFLKKTVSELVEGQVVQSDKLVSELEKNSEWSYFYRLLLNAVTDKYISGDLNLKSALYFIKFLESSVKNSVIFNQSDRMLLDCILFRTSMLFR